MRQWLYAGEGTCCLQVQHDSLGTVSWSYSTLRPSSSFLMSVTKVIILCPVLLIRNWSQTFISGLMPSLVLTLSRSFMVYHRFAYKLQRASCASHGRTKHVFVGSSSSAAARPILEKMRYTSRAQPGAASVKVCAGVCSPSRCVLCHAYCA